MNIKSLSLFIFIIFVFGWILVAANELIDYQNQKKAIERDIQERIMEIINKQQQFNATSTR